MNPEVTRRIALITPVKPVGAQSICVHLRHPRFITKCLRKKIFARRDDFRLLRWERLESLIHIQH